MIRLPPRSTRPYALFPYTTLFRSLRRRGPGGRPLFLLTRSCAILDLESVGLDEAVIFCPANHSPPTRVAPYPGAPDIGRAHVCTPVTNAHLVYRLLLEQKTHNKYETHMQPNNRKTKQKNNKP